MLEKSIIDLASAKFQQETGFLLQTHFYDKDIKMFLKTEDYDIPFRVVIKTNLNKARLSLISEQLNKKSNEIPLLITDYMNPELFELTKKLNLNFLDCAGNVYINIPPLLINIKGNKRTEEGKYKETSKGFSVTDLQTIYTLLCNQRLEQNPIREIAELAGVAKSSIHLTLKTLKEQGFLIENYGIKKIVNKEKLLQKWIALFPDKLKIKHLIGRYEIADNFFWEKINIQQYDALWGGETAAAKLTSYLTPAIHTVYIGNKQGEFILRNKMKKNPAGNVELYNRFWKFKEDNELDVVNPILVYADLIATGEPRNIETARIIYEKEVIRYIK